MPLYGEWVEENVFATVAHRLYVFTLPRLVRHFFARRRGREKGWETGVGPAQRIDSGK